MALRTYRCGRNLGLFSFVARVGMAWLVAQFAWAAPDEITVYDEEMNRPGQWGLEQHVNYAVRGQQVPDYPGQLPSHHVLRVTPEFSYGVSDTLEAGLYVPVALAPEGNAYLNGLRLRLKYIAPRQPEQNGFYGLSVELARDCVRVAESLYGMELRPIVGYRDALWLVSFNPILNVPLSGNSNSSPQFEPALKLLRRIGETVQGGLEYYGEYGAFSGMKPAGQWAHTVYGVVDTMVWGMNLNVGVGRGNANAVDEWVVKTVLEFSWN